MTDQPATDDGDAVLTLQDLVQSRMAERGWSLMDLVARSRYEVSKSRWQQLANGDRQNNFPKPSTLQAIADALEVDLTTVLLASAQTIGLDVRRRGPDFAHLLPAGIDALSDRMRHAILTVARAAVAEHAARETEDDTPENTGRTGRDGVSQWAKADSPNRRNARTRTGDPRS